MEVKEAVRQAKTFVQDLLSEESLSNLGLEEVALDEEAHVWNVTLGFSRPWNSQRSALTVMTGEPAIRRTYRVVRINDSDGKVLSIEKRPDDKE